MNSIPGLQDIQGLDHISVWPLAVGWWILIGLLLVAMISVIFICFRRKAQLRNWKSRVLKQLDSIERNLNPQTAHDTAVTLAVIVRRLAIHRFSRSECARLKGEAWLRWLSENDESKFDWLKSGHYLVDAPYQPRGMDVEIEPLKQTINAAKGWVR